MKKEMQYRPSINPKWIVAVCLTAVVCLVIGCVVQVIGGIKMIAHNNDLYREVAFEDIDNIKINEKVLGRVMRKDTVYYYTVDTGRADWERYLVVLTPERKMMVFYANSDASPVSYDFMQMMMAPEEIKNADSSDSAEEPAAGYEFFDYGGFGRVCTAEVRKAVQSHLPKDLYAQYGLTEDDFAPVYLECSDSEVMNGAYSVFEIVWTFLTAAVMLGLAIFLFYKSIKNMSYHSRVTSGAIPPPLTVRPEDIPTEMGTYDGYESGSDPFKNPFDNPYEDPLEQFRREHDENP